MVWKLLSALSAVCLGVACYSAVANKKAYEQENKRLAYYQANLKAAKEQIGKFEEAKKGYDTQYAEASKGLEGDKAAVVEFTAKATAKEQELALAKANLDQVAKVVNDLQKRIEDAGDIKALLAQIDTIRKERAEAEAALANQNQRLVSAQGRINSLNQEAVDAEEREARGRRGIVDDDFSAKIAQSYTDWGFVVLNKGNGGGVFANADLEVKRGKDVIAKLKVRNVEQNSSVAELVPGSLVEGSSIRSGDTVVAAAEQSAKAEKGVTTPAAGGAAPAAPGAPGAAPAAPGAAPAMGNDPFATGAPAAAPGAAPAPMGGDPFGAPAPAPAAGAPMGGDPFGAPPAAGTPPAAPGAGTPAAPSTTDPFGGAPTAPKQP